MRDTDIVLVQIPRMSPSLGLGVWLLHEQLVSQGYRCQIYDANLDLHSKYGDRDEWQELETWAIHQRTLAQASTQVQEVIVESLQSWANKIKSFGSDKVGISVFSTESRNWAQYLCLHIRMIDPDCKILLGGRGINDPGLAKATFAEQCLDWELCDYYLNGESEKEIVSFMQNKSDKVNQSATFFINDDLKKNKFAMIDPGLLKPYQYVNNWYDGKDSAMYQNVEFQEALPHLRTYSTRGCIKTCTFCDVHLLRDKFSIRPAQNLFEEIRWAIEDHDVRTVVFTDDMINGSNKQFTQWLVLLSKYIQQNNIQGFHWRSQFGIKSRRSTPGEMFELLHITGAQLIIGVDHFSDSVLDHMRKKYHAEDIYHYLDNFLLHPITIDPMMFVVGYPTETLEDFAIMKKSLLSMAQYKDIISLIDLGNLCTVPVGSELESLNGMQINHTRLDWYYQGNATLTNQEKMRRRQELDDVLEAAGFANRKKRTYWLRIQGGLGI